MKQREYSDNPLYNGYVDSVSVCVCVCVCVCLCVCQRAHVRVDRAVCQKVLYSAVI